MAMAIEMTMGVGVGVGVMTPVGCESSERSEVPPERNGFRTEVTFAVDKLSIQSPNKKAGPSAMLEMASEPKFRRRWPWRLSRQYQDAVRVAALSISLSLESICYEVRRPYHRLTEKCF
jgi:hypothetical protein